MAALWSDSARFEIWLDIELSHLEARETLGTAPKGTAAKIRSDVHEAGIDTARILEIEAVCRHDVIAFLTHIEELAGPDARFLHVGLTSSDVLDTCLAIQMKRAAEEILADLDVMLAALSKQAHKHKMTPMVGRSHGIHAEPSTFGLAMAGFYAEFERGKRDVANAIREISYGTLSGAVGTYSATTPEVESIALESMGLSVEPVATQVIPRDRHARYFGALATVAASVERLAVQIRHWQRTEVREAEEPFRRGQKGSSAMPHKRNPILSENVTGLARLLRSNAGAALENVALWHERDISHSSVERVIGPDATILTDFMLRRISRVIDDLVVHEDHLRANLGATNGLIFSGQVLLAMVDKGMERQAAYALVQRNALPAWEEGSDFATNLLNDSDVRALLSEQDIRDCFDLNRVLQHVDTIFRRVFP